MNSTLVAGSSDDNNDSIRASLNRLIANKNTVVNLDLKKILHKSETSDRKVLSVDEFHDFIKNLDENL